MDDPIIYFLWSIEENKTTLSFYLLINKMYDTLFKIKVHANLKSVNTQFSQKLHNMNLRSKITEQAM